MAKEMDKVERLFAQLGKLYTQREQAENHKAQIETQIAAVNTQIAKEQMLQKPVEVEMPNKLKNKNKKK